MKKSILYITILKIDNDFIAKDLNSIVEKIQKQQNVIFSSYILRERELKTIEQYISEIKLIGLDGTISNIVNMQFMIKNLDKIRMYQMQKISDNIDYYRDEAERLTHLDPDKNLLDCIRGAVMQKGYLNSMNIKLDKKHEDKNTESEIMGAIIDTRKENKADEAQNEFDIVNSALESNYPGKRNWQVLKCVYNGEVIEPDEMVYKLKSHMLPDFLTQVDIRDTLEDEYTIETNFCIVKRSKGGSISIEDKK